MNYIITEQRPELSQFVARALQVEGFGPHRTLAVANENEILAVVVYSKYDGYQCEISIASKKPIWASRRILSMLFGYPFFQLGCKRINLIIREDNAKSIALAERLGFVRETKEAGLREYCSDGTNAHIYGLLRNECRWVKEMSSG